MRLITTMFGSLLLCLSAVGQGHYTVFSVSGDVQLQKSETSDWISVEKRMDVGQTDICHIADNGSISIIDNETKLIYRSQHSGEMDIKTIIDKAIEQSAQTSRLIAEELRNAIAGDSGNKNSFTAKGSTSRGQDLDDVETTTEEIYAAIVSAITNDGEVIENDGSLFGVMRKTIADGEFFFSVMNCTDMEFVVNIVCYDRASNIIALCFNLQSCDQLTIPSGMQVDMEQFIFADEDNAEWFLIASSFDYDIAKLQTMLKKRELHTTIGSCDDSVFVMRI